MDAGKRTLSDIFNGNRILEIPFFQRAYVWGPDQCERLLEDMEQVTRANAPYFLGSVILKQKPTNTKSNYGDLRIIIDGQQRLTTLSIFFKVLALKSGDDYDFNRMFNLRDGLAIQHNYHDVEAYRKIIGLKSLEEVTGTDNLSKAYAFFRDSLEPGQLDVRKILANLLFVGIDVGENEDEQQIFDTINSLGVKLTTAELLKNYFFSRDEIDDYEAYWKATFEKDEETRAYWDREITTGKSRRTFIDLFFYAYLQIKIQDKSLNVRTDDKLEFSRLEQLFYAYKKFVEVYLQHDKKQLLTEIRAYATTFRENFNYGVLDSDLTGQSAMARINALIFGLDTSTLIPYILYVAHNLPEAHERSELFGIIETYVMRRMVVHANTRNYNQLFAERLIGNEVLSRQKFLEYIANQEDRVNFMPSDAELEQGFGQSVLINRQAAGILYLIESKIRNSRLHATQLLGLNKYSLEHLMPKKWENHWNAEMGEEQRRQRDRTLLTLGNLTIITQTLNATIRDAAWADKQAGKAGKPGLRTYAAGLETLGVFLDEPTWDEQAMARRADFLYQKAREVWSI